MNKFVLITFLSLVIIFSSTALATTWTQNSWTNSVPKSCGDYSSDCSSCGDVQAYKSNNVSANTFTIDQGTWRIKASATSINVQNFCVGGGCIWPSDTDCYVKGTQLVMEVLVDGTSVISQSVSGPWAVASSNDNTPAQASSSVGSISSDWKEVTCSKSSCQVQYRLKYEIYGYAHDASGEQYIYGNANFNAQIDYEKTFDFSLAVNLTSGSVYQGGSNTTTVNATLTAGTTQSVSFSATGLPSGATYSFSQSSCSPTCTSTLTISTSASTPTGSYTITITATGGGITRAATYTLTVNQKPAFDFSLSLDPTSGSVNQGSSITSNVTVKLLSGDVQPVTLSYSIQPTATGININFNPSYLSPTTGGVNSTMTISTTSSTATGGYTITVTGTAGTLTKTATYTLTVNQPPVQCTHANPTVTIAPSSNSSLAGSMLQYTVSIANGDNGGDCTRQTYSLTYACPAGWTCSLASSSLSVTPGGVNSTTINITSPSSAVGSNSFTVIATSGSYVGTGSATYSIGLPCSGTLMFSFIPSSTTPLGTVSPSVSGLSSCDNKKIEFRNNTCTGAKIGECIVSNTGCAGLPTTAPNAIGSYSYAACLDRNGDGDFGDDGEANSTILNVVKVCPRSNPSIGSDATSDTKEPGKSYTFKISVRNADGQSCGDSAFTLRTDCPLGWTCRFDNSSITISPGISASANLTITSATTALGNYLINVSALNSADNSYNNTVNINFNAAQRCDGAAIKITDVYFYGSVANVTVENIGKGSLTINSAVMTDQSGKKYTPVNLPITSFNVGDKENLKFNAVPKCENFSKVVVSTDCPSANATYDSKARCLNNEPTPVVKISNVVYNNGIVQVSLKNDGGGSIESSLIKFLIDGNSIGCDNSFTLVAKGTANCNISYTCEQTARLQITSPNTDEKVFSCLGELKINVAACKDISCSTPSNNTFQSGESVYLNIKKDSGTDVTAILYRPDGGSENLDLSKPYKPTQPGIYSVNITASKEGYKPSVQILRFAVLQGNSGFLLKVVLIGVFLIILVGFVYYRLKKTKKKEGFDELYEKYRRKNYETLYRKYGKKPRPRRRF